jgi:hypothetical protein
MRKVLAAAAIATMLAGGVRVAGAVAHWWVPKERDCPTFDTQAACTAYCAQDPARCGGNTTCISGSGAKRPQC